jgi:dihydrofolate reductase
VGGGEIIKPLLSANLIDEMIIFIIPVILGRGIRLFPGTETPLTLNFKTQAVQLRSNGVVQMSFKKD